MGIEPPPCPGPSPSIPSKSRSLRAGSVQKRLQTEAKLKGSKKPGLSSRAARMTKYRRKTANAKERDRMKLLNVAFERLRGVMPDVKSITKEEKDTKVTTLRAAISYISGLQSLLADCEAGLVDPAQFQEDELEEKKPPQRVAKLKKRVGRVGGKPVVVRGVKVGGGKGGSEKEGVSGGEGGVGGGGTREGRSVPVTLSMKTETVFTKLLQGGVGRDVVGVGGGIGVEFNLLSLQPLPFSSLQQPSPTPSPSLSSLSSFSPSPSSPPYLPCSPLPPHPSPPTFHIGTKCNLSKQPEEAYVGRQFSSLSFTSSSSPSSPADVDMLEDEDDDDNDTLAPTIEQLFQRSFSYELRELWGGELVMLDTLQEESVREGTDKLELEDIASIIGGDGTVAKLLA